jgi:hypothetical protein
MIPLVASVLSDDKRRLLNDVIAPKFEAYFLFTKDLSRSIPLPGGIFLYPDNSLISDLNFLWIVFVDVHEIVGRVGLADLVRRDPFLQQQIFQIVEGDGRDPDGEFWLQRKCGTLSRLRTHDAVNKYLKDVLRTLRNGFAHANWLYEDLSASDYWKKRGWDTTNAPAVFNLSQRAKKNYLTYIADAHDFDGLRFWKLENLRILITPAHVLRYHLHLLLKFLLTGHKVDVFGSVVQ